MSRERELLQNALIALKQARDVTGLSTPCIDEIEEELEKPEPEPVAWIWKYIGDDPMRNHIEPVARAIHEMNPKNNPYPDSWSPLSPLYTSPPQQKPLSDDGKKPCVLCSGSGITSTSFAPCICSL